MTEKIANKIIDAYKFNPILTGLLLLNVVIFVVLVWYILQVQKASGVFIMDLQKNVLELARECK